MALSNWSPSDTSLLWSYAHAGKTLSCHSPGNNNVKSYLLLRTHAPARMELPTSRKGDQSSNHCINTLLARKH